MIGRFIAAMRLAGLAKTEKKTHYKQRQKNYNKAYQKLKRREKMAFKNIGDILLGQRERWLGRRYSREKKPTLPKAYHKNKKDFFDFLKLIQNWPAIVGDKLARQTLPLKISNGKLFIMTSHPLYAQQLQYFEREMMDKMVELFPHIKKKIRSIGFQATEYFDVIQTQQKVSVENKARGRGEEREEKRFHQFDPKYIKLREKVREELSVKEVEDQELSTLLEKMNILYYQQRDWEEEEK